MKKFKKFVSVLCAISMILAMSVSAFAATPAYRIDPSYTPEHYAGTLSDDEMAVMLARSGDVTTGKATMPYNDGSGTTGLIIFQFTAQGETVNWNIDWNNSDAEDTYHFRLWRVNEGLDPTPVEPARQASFGVGQKYTGLIEGEKYFLRASSMSTGKDVSVTYSYWF